MQAIIEYQGKQIWVKKGDIVTFDRIHAEIGSEITFDTVLWSKDQEKSNIGKPSIGTAKVVGKVLSHGRGEKIDVLKYKNKINYHVKRGHRQDQTDVEISKIIL